MKKLSVGLRLTLWYVAIFAVGQLVFGVGMWVLLRHYLYDIADDSLESQVEDLQKFFKTQVKDTSFAGLQRALSETYVDHAGDYLQVYAEDGRWVYQSEFMKANRLKQIEPERIKELKFEDRWLDGKPVRFATQKFVINRSAYAAETGVLIDDVVDTLSVFRLYLLMVAPLVLLVAAGGGYWLSRRALTPVDAIVRSAREIGGTNLDRRLEKLDTGDELQRLSDTLNEMLARIEGAFQRVIQFTADASHELRTPVSLIRTEAELALRRSRGEVQYRESLEHILQEAEQTTLLIEKMLALARADSGHMFFKMHPVEVRAVLRSAADSWRQVAAVYGLDFRERDETKELFVMADEEALRRTVNILLDNAFKYTMAPGRVGLELEHKDDKAILTVRDTGIGIPLEEQEKIFERFYRVDKARVRGTQGAGLGLAIAQWIVQQHGGAIRVESSPDKGSSFRIELPLITAPARNAAIASSGAR
jgi:heavy metal sensor kinase